MMVYGWQAPCLETDQGHLLLFLSRLRGSATPVGQGRSTSGLTPKRHQ